MDSYDSEKPGKSEPPGAQERTRPPRAPNGILALSYPYQVAAAIALGMIVVLTAVHLSMVFLHVAPSNTVSKKYGKAVDDWVYPEFEQNWKLFAPNPLQQNIDVQARAEIRGKDGGLTTTGWTDLSAQDGAELHGNPLPSHVDQNELRRGWDFFTGSHTSDNKPIGLRGDLSERYIRRIVVMRLNDGLKSGSTVERIRVRSATTAVKAPPWSSEKIDTRTSYRVLDWWTVVPQDRTEADR
ncbi:DUF5819 family protein [Streptomyces sp. NPDC051322]|uniref:DUF5819 family protein n=1 Tax=Streptomyces sp. NPDC051322 TaxID=3154645 RepID=UPI0034509E99